MAEWMLLLLAAVISADAAPPVQVTKPPRVKAYVVYVTVVELDEDGNETVVFTPKVQTTGSPAGVTVDNADGRRFEFKCQLADAEHPRLESPPLVAPAVAAPPPSRPLTKTAKPKTSSPAPVSQSSPITAVNRNEIAKGKPAASTSKPEELFMRTYDVTELLGFSGEAQETDFAPLIQTIQRLAAPASWNDKASIKPFTSTKSLVVKQTAAGHRAVAAALADLKVGSQEKEKRSE